MQPRSMWLVLRGLGLVLLLTLLLLRVATPRTQVIPGQRLTPSGALKDRRGTTPGPSGDLRRLRASPDRAPLHMD